MHVVALLVAAQKSRRNPQPYLYDDALDALSNWINGLTADENGFTYHMQQSGKAAGLATLVRALPGPPPKGMPQSYVDIIDAAAAARDAELAQLRVEAQALEDHLATFTPALAAAQDTVARLQEAAQKAVDAASEAVDRLEGELRGDWKNRLDAWDLARTAKDDDADGKAAEHLKLLGHASRLGDRLLENVTASLVAKDWGQRASRERRAGWLTRIMGIVALIVAALVGGLIVDSALRAGSELTLGDGILRSSLILAIAGIGAALLAESRRHFREADTSEEIKLTLTAIEPFYAGDDVQRAQARKALGEAVFVRNVLSRFSHRDAAKHGEVAEVQLSDVVDDLTKAVDTAAKAGAVK